MVIDTETGERWPIWVELDSNATTPAETALLIHPAENYASGHRYIVAMRKLKGGPYEEDKLEAPAGFRAYRDDLEPDYPGANAQRARFEQVFKDLRDAGIKRSNLYLAWALHRLDRREHRGAPASYAQRRVSQLGDESMDDEMIQGDAPSFDVISVNEPPERSRAGARR